MSAPVADEAFNVGTGVKTTISEVVHELIDLTGVVVAPEYRAQTQAFVQYRVGSTEKAERLVGFRAEVPLRKGLGRLIAWRGRQGTARSR